MAKYITYIQNEDSTLLDTDNNYVQTCDSYPEALAVAADQMGEDQRFYQWTDKGVAEMMKSLVTSGHYDMLNGRVFYLIEWDGVEDPLEVARRHDAPLRQ